MKDAAVEHPTGSILVIDDDRVCAESIADLLREAGHRTRSLYDPRAAHRIVEEWGPDVIVLDVIMPFVDGISLCVELRQRTAVGIVILSAKRDSDDRTLGLRVGADDYIGKPFDASELEARVGAVLRRCRRRHRDVRRIGSLELDRRAIRVLAGGAALDLTPTEFKLLDLLTARPGRVFTRTELLQDVWGGRIAAPTRAVDVHLGRLRRKLMRSGIRDLQVEARRGFGYRALHVLTA